LKCVAIVVSYNSSEELPSCLQSLLAQRDVSLDVWVVDNASKDASAALVRERFPSVHLLANSRNVGFARANNQVFEQADGPYYALVNPDTVLPPDAVATCVQYLEQHPRAGIVGTPLVSPEGRPQPSCQAFLGLWSLFEETFFLDRLPRDPSRPTLRGTTRATREPMEADWLAGAFLVVRQAVIREIGGFDPAFFMYAEEMDWCYRARRAGWKVVYLPAPEVVHVGGASSRPIAGPMFIENMKGRLRFFHKHRGPLAIILARALLAISILFRGLAWESQWAVVRLTGRAPAEALLFRLTIFRAARRWVLRGLPLSPPEIEGAAAP
jgi:GT2 family glycosyltransferase